MIDYKALEDMIYRASKDVFEKLVAENPDEHFYTFGLWTDDSLQFLNPSANSMEKLISTVAMYNAEVDTKDDIPTTQEDMMWSYGDWGYVANIGQQVFAQINSLLNELFHADISIDEHDEATTPVWGVIEDAIKRLCDEDFFISCAGHTDVTVLLVGDLPEEFTDDFARAWNPMAIADRYINWSFDS